MTAPTTASNASRVATKRARSDQRHRGRPDIAWPAALSGRPDNIARSAVCMDHWFSACVDLLPQVGDVQLDHVGLAAEVVAPDPIEYLRLAQHPARIAHQEPQQLELGR